MILTQKTGCVKSLWKQIVSYSTEKGAFVQMFQEAIENEKEEESRTSLQHLQWCSVKSPHDNTMWCLSPLHNDSIQIQPKHSALYILNYIWIIYSA